MSFSLDVLVTFRIWLARLFGFQTLKQSDRFYKNGSLTRYYSLLLVVLIVILEGRSFAIKLSNQEITHETGVALVILSLTGAIAAISAILSDSFIHISEKVNLYNNFLKVNDIFLKESFNLSTALSHTNSVFVILVTLKVIHSTYVIWSLGWGLSILYVIFKKNILSSMTLQILTEICTCESHVKCIRYKIIWAHTQHLGARNGIDFRATSFRLNDYEEKITLKENQNSTIKAQMNIYTLINENLKLISKRFKYAMLFLILTSSMGIVLIGNNTVSGNDLPFMNNTLMNIGSAAEILWYIGGIAVGTESLSSEVERLIQTIAKIAILEQKDQKAQNDLNGFLNLLLERKPSYMIAGVVKLDFSFLYSVAAVVTSYMIIFYQFDHAKN